MAKRIHPMPEAERAVRAERARQQLARQRKDPAFLEREAQRSRERITRLRSDPVFLAKNPKLRWSRPTDPRLRRWQEKLRRAYGWERARAEIDRHRSGGGAS